VPPFSLLIKPAGPDCNLACVHCFYAGKAQFFGGSTHRMSYEILDKLTQDYLLLRLPASSFYWQGGEPTLMGLEFFKQAIGLQKKYGANGQVVSNALQTNAMLLDDNWCEFLRQYRFLVGVSLDGPAQYHDYYRKNATGQGSFERVMSAITLLKKHHVEFNILTLLTNHNVNDPDVLFEFLLEQGITYMQFIPCFEKEGDHVAPYSITPEQYGRFLCRLLDLWLAYGPQKISIRLFDSIMSYLLNGNQTICTFQKKCNDYVVVEHNGDVFACDFFVEPQWLLGNLLEMPIDQLVNSQTKRLFSEKKNSASNRCFVCRHFAFCRGGCLKERCFLNNDYKDKSYFCQSYQIFFDYAVPKLVLLLPNIIR
jgi:uncharacterized protein